VKRAKAKKPEVKQEDMDITRFRGINAFGPHADIAKENQRSLDNYDLYDTYIKSRRGSTKFISAVTPGTDVLEKVIFKDGTDNWLVVQQTSGVNSSFSFIKLVDGSAWATVKDKATGLVPYVITGSVVKADMFVSNGKVYVIHPKGNAILELDGAIFKNRRIGLPAPQITTVNSVNSGQLKGKRIYALELIYKDTAVNPDVPIIASGPNRVLLSTNPTLGQGAFAYTPTENLRQYTLTFGPTLNDGTAITDTVNAFWTHLRVWRTKDITTATNAAPDLTVESEILGRVDEMYPVAEYTKAQITSAPIFGGGVYTLTVDNVLDDDMPFPKDLITGDRLDMIPLPQGTTGVYKGDRIWVSGVTQLPGPTGLVVPKNIESKIYYTPEAKTIYSESLQADNAIEAEPGDGQKMIALFNFRNDLIGLKEGKTGIIRNADPSLGWVTEDEVTGVTSKEFAQFVPDIGICARVSDQKDFKIFGFDLQWTSTFEGQNISRPIRDIIKTFTDADIDFLYINGKLMISGGKGELLVLATEEKSGWSKYVYPFNSKSEAVMTFDKGQRALVINAGQPIMEIEAEDAAGKYITTDYNPVTAVSAAISCPLATWMFQWKEGRYLVEENYLSIVAQITAQMTAVTYVNGRQWQPSFPLLIDPADYPDSLLKETEYQGYEEYRAIGNYVHYVITATAPVTIYSIQLTAMVHQGRIAPGFDPFLLLPATVVVEPPWAVAGNTLVDTIVETGLPGSPVYVETGLAADDTILEKT